MFEFEQDFPKADPVSRGCGDREPGGVYAESGLSSKGRPLEEFLVDPPLPIPPGLDLVNKPQTWQRMLPSGEPALDGDGLPLYDLLIWVGAEFYTYCSIQRGKNNIHLTNPAKTLVTNTCRTVCKKILVLISQRRILTQDREHVFLH